ncbi:hypothetical protein P8452_53826 [Trifolium repens]|nr:hypothetical protein P8452_53826 [Trifolium repens]
MLSPNAFLQDFCVPDTVNLETNGFEVEDSSLSPSVTSSNGEYQYEHTRYSNNILRYISDILMDEEDDLELKPCMLQECLRLQAAEKSFYDVLGHNYPNSSCKDTTDTDGSFSRGTASFESNSSSCSIDNSYESDWVNHVGEFDCSSLQLKTPVVEKNYHYVIEAANDIHNGSWNAIQPGIVQEFSASAVPREKRSHKMNVDVTCNEQEGRGSKLSAIFSDELEPPQILDEVLLYQRGKAKGTDSHSKKVSTTNNAPAVDFWTMLTQCAQAVASYNQRNTNELLKQIRQHSSPFGDGLQRLAHYFANGLEIRLAAETPSYKPLDLATAGDMLKAYKLFVTSSPLQRMTNVFLTNTIFRLVKNESSVHIIDFGICYGFQWPCLIKKLSSRPGGPPKLRITGIDLPRAGFRPAERVEETGRRLENYCKKFNVPFEYNCIAQKWETVRLEDLKMDRNEITVVSCLYRLKNMPDETVAANCPREALLKLIRMINPRIFFHGVVNGSYSAPFFLTRFREALYHFSSLFDMFEANVPREDTQRLMLERELFGRDAINVISCEGAERVERPETYKQWQLRNMRVGFKQIRLDSDLVNVTKAMVKREHHKDFAVDEDGKWVLHGWKGRVLNAFSAWVPA